MKGLELSKEYFLTYGLPMLEKDYKEYLSKFCVGLVGHGSECLGYDDEISIDHDFEPGFIIWLDDDTYNDIGFKLTRSYLNLPNEFKGYKINKYTAFGSKYKGVHTIKEFYSFYLPNGDIPSTLEEWLYIPDYYLKEATNGEIYFDNAGIFTSIRNKLLNRPDDIRLKKLASKLLSMAQSGQYNYERCSKHNELLAASIALSEFTTSCAEVIYLINNKYSPYYKWIFKGLEELIDLGYIKSDLEILMKNPYNISDNLLIIEKICSIIRVRLNELGLSSETTNYLEASAYSVNNKIKDINLRNLEL